jgi:hypothetical protein
MHTPAYTTSTSTRSIVTLLVEMPVAAQSRLVAVAVVVQPTPAAPVPVHPANVAAVIVSVVEANGATSVWKREFVQTDPAATAATLNERFVEVRVWIVPSGPQLFAEAMDGNANAPSDNTVPNSSAALDNLFI